MTYVGPYSEATLMYEPSEPRVVEEEFLTGRVESGSILDFVKRISPNFLNLIKTANLLTLYNSSQQKHTLFLPYFMDPIPFVDPNTAYKICKFSTTPGDITTDMLASSPNFVIYSLLSSENLNIQNNLGVITIENKVLLNGNIKCTNGMIQFIDSMLYPTSETAWHLRCPPDRLRRRGCSAAQGSRRHRRCTRRVHPGI